MLRNVLMSLCVSAFAASLLLLPGKVASANTIVQFQQGTNNLYHPVTPYDGTDDRAIMVGGFPGAAETTMIANEGHPTNPRRIVLRFSGLDVIGASDAANITSATLTLTQWETSAPTPDFTVSVYQISDANAGWTEAGASWITRVWPSDPWEGSDGLSTPGTDYVDTVLDTQTYLYGDAGGDMNGHQLVFDLPVALIQQWITGVNAGLLIRTDDPDTSNFAQFATSESPTVAYRPMLTLTIVPEPASLSLVAAGATLLLLRRRGA